MLSEPAVYVYTIENKRKWGIWNAMQTTYSHYHLNSPPRSVSLSHTMLGLSIDCLKYSVPVSSVPWRIRLYTARVRMFRVLFGNDC